MTGLAEPLFFGRGARICGFFHEAGTDGIPTPGFSRSAGVVLVNPFGYEALCVHRAYRRLAERLAAAGFAALRFDLEGTGDSAGDDRESGRVAAWLGSIGAAIDELRLRARSREIALFGVRLGALLSLASASQRGDVSALALFGPCLSGRAFTREMRAFRRMNEKDATGAKVRGRGERDEEAAGFLLTEATIAELGKLDGLTLDPHGARVLVIPRDDMPSGEDKLVEKLAAKTKTEARAAAGYAAMMQDPHKSVVSGPAFDAVVDWLSGLFPAALPETLISGGPPLPPLVKVRALSAALQQGPASTRTPNAAGAGADVREELARFGDGDRLFGVIAEPPGEPSDAQSASRPAVLLLNAGAIHRVGPNRTYVALARSLAAQGFSVLRLDLGGIGDSPPSLGAPENRVYSRDAVADVDAAMGFLSRQSGARRFVLIGLCSGAYVSFHTSLVDERVDGAVMINPQTFTWKEGDSLEISRSKNYNDVRHYQRSVFRLESWTKALRGEVDFKKAAEALGRRASVLAEARARQLIATVRGTVAPDDIRGAFALLARRRVQVLLVMSEGDPGLDYLATELGNERLRRATPTYRLDVIDGPDHTFTPLWSQDELCDHVRSFMADLARLR